VTRTPSSVRQLQCSIASTPVARACSTAGSLTPHVTVPRCLTHVFNRRVTAGGGSVIWGGDLDRVAFGDAL
jgi:hypothetical protein